MGKGKTGFERRNFFGVVNVLYMPFLLPGKNDGNTQPSSEVKKNNSQKALNILWNLEDSRSVI